MDELTYSIIKATGSYSYLTWWLFCFSGSSLGLWFSVVYLLRQNARLKRELRKSHPGMRVLTERARPVSFDLGNYSERDENFRASVEG